MMNYKYGDIVLVNVIFSNGKGVKKRPALIISSDRYNGARQEVVISAITSNVDRILYGDTKIEKWKEAGLIFPSLVTGIIQTIKTILIKRKLGILSTSDLDKFRKNLNDIMSVESR